MMSAAKLASDQPEAPAGPRTPRSASPVLVKAPAVTTLVASKIVAGSAPRFLRPRSVGTPITYRTLHVAVVTNTPIAPTHAGRSTKATPATASGPTAARPRGSAT